MESGTTLTGAGLSMHSFVLPTGFPISCPVHSSRVQSASDLHTPTTLQDGAAYFKTFLAVLKNVSKEETTEYVLTLLDEALQGEPNRLCIRGCIL